jgi:hypothetical protein
MTHIEENRNTILKDETTPNPTNTNYYTPNPYFHHHENRKLSIIKKYLSGYLSTVSSLFIPQVYL